jgi:hypothetical protein
VADEIVPKAVKHSHAYYNNEKKNGASRAIDLDFQTRSRTKEDSNGDIWLKISLERVHCIDQVVRYNSDGGPENSWTCSKTDCSSCDGTDCSGLILTVSTERTGSENLPEDPECKNGDTVKLTKTTVFSLMVVEISVIGKQGEITKLSLLVG